MHRENLRLNAQGLNPHTYDQGTEGLVLWFTYWRRDGPTVSSRRRRTRPVDGHADIAFSLAMSLGFNLLLGVNDLLGPGVLFRFLEKARLTTIP